MRHRLVTSALVGAICVCLLAGAPLRVASADDLADARTLARSGSFDDAIRLVAKVTKAEPANVAALRFHQDLVRAWQPKVDPTTVIPVDTPLAIKAGLEARLLDGAKAAGALETVMKAEGTSPLFQLDLARAYLAADKASQADGVLGRFLKDTPDQPEAMVLHGLTLFARGKHTGGRSCLEKALTAVPGWDAAAVPLAAAYGRAKKDEDARRVLQDALSINPRQPLLLLALADDQMRVGDAATAVRTLRSVFETEGHKLPVHERLAEAHRQLKAYKDAEASAVKALGLDKDSVPALRTLGFVKQKRRDWAGALEAYEQVVTLQPDDPQAHVDVGFVKVISEDRRGARRSFERALKLDKHHLDANLKMGVYAYLGDDPKRAKKHLAVVLKSDKQNVPANRYMGYVLLREGKSKNAYKHFKIVSELREKDADSVRMMGKALLAMGKLDDAVASFREAIGRDDKNAQAYFDLAKGLQDQEQWEDAEAMFRKAIALDATFTHPNLYLAELLDEYQGDAEAALPYYKRYLELGGTDKGNTIDRRVKQIERELAEKK